MTKLNKEQMDEIWGTYNQSTEETQDGRMISFHIHRAFNGQVHLKRTADEIAYKLYDELGELNPEMEFEVTIKRVK